jgi:hypothetical protein
MEKILTHLLLTETRTASDEVKSERVNIGGESSAEED